MQTLLYIYTGGGVLLALLSLPLIQGKIKPNPFYGFRVPRTLETPELWFAVNKYFARRQLIVALVEVAAAIGLYFWPNISIDGYALSALGIFVAAFSIAFIQGWRYLKTLG